MPWFKVDDSFHSHPKTLAASPAALGLWVVAGSWAAANPDNGFVPAYVLQRLLPGADPLAAELVERRLWVKCKGGFRFHDWARLQPSKEEVETNRKKATERQRNRRLRLSGQVTGDPVTAVSQRDSQRDDGVSHSPPSRPVPSRPVPVVPSELQSAVGPPQAATTPIKRGHRLPADFEVTLDMYKWAQERTPGIDTTRATERFRNHYESISGAKGLKIDWQKCWRNWLLSDFAKLPPARQQNYQREPGQRRAMY